MGRWGKRKAERLDPGRGHQGSRGHSELCGLSGPREGRGQTGGREGGTRLGLPYFFKDLNTGRLNRTLGGSIRVQSPRDLAPVDRRVLFSRQEQPSLCSHPTEISLPLVRRHPAGPICKYFGRCPLPRRHLAPLPLTVWTAGQAFPGGCMGRTRSPPARSTPSHSWSHFWVGPCAPAQPTLPFPNLKPGPVPTAQHCGLPLQKRRREPERPGRCGGGPGYPTSQSH